MARPIETTTLRMNRTLGRLRLLIEASAIILTKRRQPRIDAGGRRCAAAPLPRSFLVSGGRRPARSKSHARACPHTPPAWFPTNVARNSHVNLSNLEIASLRFCGYLDALQK